jgi:hypothetical protein
MTFMLSIIQGIFLRIYHAQISYVIIIYCTTATPIDESYYSIFRYQIPYLVFILASLIIAVVTFQKKLAVLRLLTNLYLMTQLAINNGRCF